MFFKKNPLNKTWGSTSSMVFNICWNIEKAWGKSQFPHCCTQRYIKPYVHVQFNHITLDLNSLLCPICICDNLKLLKHWKDINMKNCSNKRMVSSIPIVWLEWPWYTWPYVFIDLAVSNILPKETNFLIIIPSLNVLV